MSHTQTAGNYWFLTELLPTAPGMSETIRLTPVTGIDGLTVITDWINAGCPIPGGKPIPHKEALLAPMAFDQPKVMTLTQLRPVTGLPRLHRRQIFGQDAVH